MNGLTIYPRKRRKKSELAKVNEKLEKLQKEYVIAVFGRDCFTCPAKDLEGVKCQLGHVPWPRSILSSQCVYDSAYTRIQCFSCNINRGGMGAVAYQKLKEQGVDVDLLWRHNQETKGKPFPLKERLEKILEYKHLLASQETKG